MKNNITSGIKTTILGILIILAALYTVLFMGISWLEATLPLTIGIGLLFAPYLLNSLNIKKPSGGKNENE